MASAAVLTHLLPGGCAPPSDPHRFGRIDDDGTVWLVSASGERIVGSWQAGDPEAAFAHFGRRFDDLSTEIMLMDERLASGTGDARKIKAHAIALAETLPTACVLGDVDALADRLTSIRDRAEVIAAADRSRREEHRAAQTARKEALAAEAEELAANATQWKVAGDRLRAILDEWKTISGVDRKVDDALWKRYSTARDTFNRRRGSHFAELDRERSGVRQSKERLCERAEELSESTDWTATSAEFRKLLADWKAAGRASKDVDDALWRRFKAAQDSFFTARNAATAEKEAELRANADAKEALLAEAERLDTTNHEAARAALRSIAEKWDAIGKVSRERAAELERRLRAVEKKVREADVAPASAPAAAVDGDPATAWVSNALQAAVGQWLQVDFDRPVTNAVVTLTPSATAVGAQVRRILIETVNGSTTLRFDEAGKPLTAALPYGETPWVRFTAAATDDGSAGVQFGITDLAITQYDASGFAHPVQLRHTVLVPGPPPGSAIAGWDLGSELLGRPGCAPGPDGVRCAASMALAPEEPANLSRTLTVPRPVSVTPMVWVRPRQGPKLADLIAAPSTTRASGDSDLVDILGSAYAAADGDPATAWTAPQRVVQHKTPPTLTLTLPRPTVVTGLRLAASRSMLPAHPTVVAINLGDGPQVRQLQVGELTTLWLHPRVTDTVSVSLLDWDDVIDRNALGFDQPSNSRCAALIWRIPHARRPKPGGWAPPQYGPAGGPSWGHPRVRARAGQSNPVRNGGPWPCCWRVPS